ncbi:AraC family transcriptional regulator [Acinetobacter sp. NRRL B-65365]|nr:AraC family transcriptional regulator [Acinetobacter sp. NRRL B-65365]
MMFHEDQNEVMTALVQAVNQLITTDGDHQTAIPALSLHRRSEPEATHCIYQLGLGMVLQGEKQIIVGQQILTYTAGQSMLTTIDIPVISHTRNSIKHQPFLGLMLQLDLQLIREIVAEMGQGKLNEQVYPSFGVQTIDYALLETIQRLVNLLNEPVLLPLLYPILQQEIMIRLLTGANAIYLRQLIKTGSVSQKIAKAVTWLKQNFVQAVRMDDLAEQAYMSPSTFRQHFREITGMSPLQYQKQLRLQEARHLMLNQHLDVGHAAGLVGYESASQFSREYSRLFGNAPQRDIQDLQLI